MGNSIGGKKRSAKVVKIDGTSFRVKPPARAADVLRDHPGCSILDAGEVKQLGLRARGLAPDSALLPGKLYFLVELPRLPDRRAPRRAWSGALPMTARDRLESLKLYRRTVSDLSAAPDPTPTKPGPHHTPPREPTAERTPDGAVRLRMRLPKAEVARLMDQSKDPSDAAHKILQLCAAMDGAANATPPRPLSPAIRTAPKEKRIRFVAMADEIIA